MKNLCLTALGLLVAFQLSSQAGKFENLDVFALEWATDPQISPDGEWIAYVRNGMDIMKDRSAGRIWLIDREGKRHHKLTSREAGESSPHWSPDGTRLAFTSSTEEGSEIFVHWMETGHSARLTQLEKSPQGISWSPDGQQIAFSMTVPVSPEVMVKAPPRPKGAQWADPPRVTTRLRHEADGVGYIEPGFSHIFVIPSIGGTPKQITSGDFHHRGSPQWSADGNYLYFVSNRNPDWEYEWRNSEIYRASVESGEIIALTDRDGPDSGPIVSPDGRKIAYTGHDDEVQTYQLDHIYTMNADGSDKQMINLGLDRSVGNLVWNANSTGLYFQYDDRGDTKIGYAGLNGTTSMIGSNLGGTSIGRPYGGGSFSLASRTGAIAYTYSRPDSPADVALIEDGNLTVLTALNEDVLADKELGMVEEIWYESSVDDWRIQGWIVKPPGFDPENSYPLLVENHGGPISNYGPHFSPEIQLYAAAGYVVFYPNPRGSTGYGEAFGNELYHNYPGEDYNDVMDGVDAMIDLGYIDPSQLYVTGGSAGGIMTAWIIGKNNRFRAAAVVKPVMNWVSKTLVADNYFGYSHTRYPGWTWENFDVYMQFSPISLVGNVQTPTLVMVGMADLRTPPSEAKQLYHALKLRKVPTALVEIPGAFHNIAGRPSQLITKVEHVLAWFEKYR